MIVIILLLGKLWTAPELIDAPSVPVVQMYQKGDVYSFAIICQEVIYRMGVFYIKGDEALGAEGQSSGNVTANSERKLSCLILSYLNLA